MLGLSQDLEELLAVMGSHEAPPELRLADEPGDPTEDLDVWPGLVLRPHQKKEELHRLVVQRVEWNGFTGDPGRDGELAARAGFGVGYGDTVADPGGEHGLTIEDSPEYLIGIVDAPIHGEHIHELAQDIVLAGRDQGHFHPVRR